MGRPTRRWNSEYAGHDYAGSPVEADMFALDALSRSDLHGPPITIVFGSLVKLRCLEAHWMRDVLVLQLRVSYWFVLCHVRSTWANSCA